MSPHSWVVGLRLWTGCGSRVMSPNPDLCADVGCAEPRGCAATCRAHASTRTHTHANKPGDSNPGGLSRGFRDRARRVPSPEPQGRGASRAPLFRSVGTDLRRPGTAIHVLNSQYPEPGGTAPRPQVHSLNLHRLISPAGAVTHGRAVGEEHWTSMGGRCNLFSL